MTTQQWPDKEIPAPGTDSQTDELLRAYLAAAAGIRKYGDHGQYREAWHKADDAIRSRLAAGAPVQQSEPQPDDPPGSISWRTADISWICASLKEHTIFDADALQREWDAMKAIALAAEAAPAVEVARADLAKLVRWNRSADGMTSGPENDGRFVEFDDVVRLLAQAPDQTTGEKK